MTVKEQSDVVLAMGGMLHCSPKLPPEFKPFQSIPRLSREMVITEKLDGTNASITITEDGGFFTGSRNRWITPDDDNYGFSRWAHEHKDDLMQLGLGTHFGEWWGQGIQSGYGLKEKRFSLFNVGRWVGTELPKCVSLVPVLYKGDFSMQVIDETLEALKTNGSVAAEGFMMPEGVVIYHTASRTLFKKTIKHDSHGKTNRRVPTNPATLAEIERQNQEAKEAVL